MSRLIASWPVYVIGATQANSPPGPSYSCSLPKYSA